MLDIKQITNQELFSRSRWWVSDVYLIYLSFILTFIGPLTAFLAATFNNCTINKVVLMVSKSAFSGAVCFSPLSM